MRIVIDGKMVWLDDEAFEFLNHLKANYSKDEVEEWLHDWLAKAIVPALMGEESGNDISDISSKMEMLISPETKVTVN